MDLVGSLIRIIIKLSSILPFSGDYIRYAQSHLDAFAHNNRLWKYCKQGKNSDCYNSGLLNEFCSMFPFHSMKTVRLRAKLAKSLLEDDR